ncbi:sugar kinase [Microbacterium pumilum]|uniref:Sugar kinase n=1 Tax=Microbacterium pumilum TaxID=344165 RepID=A0ABP5DJA2_9MICO
MSGLPTVLAIGETMGLLTPDPLVALERASTLRLDIGGAESNVASHLAHLGVPSGWASAVGDDPIGRRVRATLGERGVDTRWVVVDPSAPTGVYFKDPGPDGTRVVYYRAGSAASQLGPAFADTLPLAEVPCVHLTGITGALSDSCRALVAAIIGRREAAGLPVSYDVNHRPSLWPSRDEAARRLRAEASRCDIVFVGLDEAHALWGTESADDVRDLLREPAVLVVKDGERAAYAFDSSGRFVEPTSAIEVVEPVGAGDAFAAGYLAGVLAGGSTEDALRTGHDRARAVLMSLGDF